MTYEDYAGVAYPFHAHLAMPVRRYVEVVVWEWWGQRYLF